MINKTSNRWFLAGMGIGIGVFALCLISYSKKNKPIEVAYTKDKDKKENDNYQSILPAQSEPKQWRLELGSNGKEVERLQIWLLRHHGWKGIITKVYDEQTDALVKKHLKADFVDRATYEKHQMGTPIHEQISKDIKNETKKKKSRERT